MSVELGLTKLVLQLEWNLVLVSRRSFFPFSFPFLICPVPDLSHSPFFPANTNSHSTEVPVNEYYEYFGPDYRLDVRPNNMEDLNTREYLEKIKIQVFESLRNSGFAPSVQGHEEPRLAHDLALEDVDDDGDDPNFRAGRSQRERDGRIQKDGEISDSEDEGEGGRRDRRDHSNGNGSQEKRKPGIMDPLLKKETNGRVSLSPRPNVNGNGIGETNSTAIPSAPIPAAAAPVAAPATSATQTTAPTTVEPQSAPTDAQGDTEMNEALSAS